MPFTNQYIKHAKLDHTGQNILFNFENQLAHSSGFAVENLLKRMQKKLHKNCI